MIDHVAKFRGDRPRDRAEISRWIKKERKKQTNKQTAAKHNATGGPNKGATENAGLENAGPFYRGGKRETNCYGTPKVSKEDESFIAQWRP